MVTPAGTQNSAPPLADFQNWNELDVAAKLSEHLDLSWISQGRFSTQFANPATYLSGLELNAGIGPHLVVSPSCFYLAFKNPAGKEGHFQVPILAVTGKQTWGRWTISDRNRLMGAIDGGNNFWAYLNRPRIDYSVGRGSWHMSTFAWDEMFYFSVFHGWTRNRFAVGARKAFTKNIAADIYYLRQDDARSQLHDFNGLGAALEVRIR